MSTIHIVCLTSVGGLPIFNRKYGDTELLPFSTVGSLNGVHLFCKSHGVKLKTTYIEDGIVVWREFKGYVTMIISAKGLCETEINYLMELVFGVLILTIGQNELSTIARVAPIKREAKIIFPIIDSLVASLDNDLLRLSECVFSEDIRAQLERLTEFSERIGSPYCCLILEDKIVAGTEGWWDLNAIDRKLLLLLYRTSIDKHDFPVYLQRKSSTAYRFVVVNVCKNMRLCIVCGSEHRYEEIERLAQKHFARNMTESLEQWHRSIPTSLQNSPDILGLILVHRTTSKYVILHNNIKQSQTSNQNSRSVILRKFVNQCIGLGLPDEVPTENSKCYRHQKEVYWCSDYHKFHAYAVDDYLICLLYNAKTPIQILRLASKNTLNAILTEKGLCW